MLPKKSSNIIALVVISLMLNFTFVKAEFPPPLPAIYYGTVKKDGDFIESGTIFAVINGEEVARTEVEILEFDDVSVYSITVPWVDAADAPTVDFFLGELEFLNGPVAWHSGWVSELNLTFYSSGVPEFHIFLPLVVH